MSDLTSAQWREIEKASVLIGNDLVSKCISLATLRNILKKSRRTNDQNALLWAVYQQIIDRGGEAMRGWTKEDLHSFFLIDCFGAETLDMFGRKRLKPLQRSSRLTKAEFSDYLDHIIRFMAEHGVVIESPEQSHG